MSQSRTDTIADGDLFVVWKTEDGDFRQSPMSVVLDYLNANLTFPSVEWVTQYAAPAASGFTVAMTSDALSRHLILSPLAGYAAGTITLPLASGCVDGQQVLVTTTQAVTALTIGSNGNEIDFDFEAPIVVNPASGFTSSCATSTPEPVAL